MVRSGEESEDFAPLRATARTLLSTSVRQHVAADIDRCFRHVPKTSWRLRYFGLSDFRNHQFECMKILRPRTAGTGTRDGEESREARHADNTPGGAALPVHRDAARAATAGLRRNVHSPAGVRLRETSAACARLTNNRIFARCDRTFRREGPDPHAAAIARLSEGGTEVQDRARATRKALLESAAHLFVERGYAGTSVNDISDHSGKTSGAIYFHYSSKEKLALAVAREQFATWPQLATSYTAPGIPRWRSWWP